MLRRIASTWYWIVVFWLVSAPVAGHAILLESTPGNGAEVKDPDLRVELRFNSRIDFKRSRLILILPDLREQALTILPGDRADLLRAQTGGLAPGMHALHWQVLSVDGHITRGDVPFTIELP